VNAGGCDWREISRRAKNSWLKARITGNILDSEFLICVFEPAVVEHLFYRFLASSWPADEVRGQTFMRFIFYLVAVAWLMRRLSLYLVHMCVCCPLRRRLRFLLALLILGFLVVLFSLAAFRIWVKLSSFKRFFLQGSGYCIIVWWLAGAGARFLLDSSCVTVDYATEIRRAYTLVPLMGVLLRSLVERSGAFMCEWVGLFWDSIGAACILSTQPLDDYNASVDYLFSGACFLLAYMCCR